MLNNLKEFKDKAVYVLRYFKSPFHKTMPYSYETLLTDLSLSAKLDIEDYKARLTEIQPALGINTKEKSVTPESFSLFMKIYDNRQLVEISASDFLADHEVALTLNDDGNIIDVRTNGGGLKNIYIEEMAGKDLYLHSIADIGFWDSLPSRMGGVVVLELPESIKSEFDESQITAFAEKYIAAGNKILVKYY